MKSWIARHGRRLAVASMAILLAAVPTASAPSAAAAGDGTSISVTGLPETLRPPLFLARPAAGGGYVRLRDLGTSRTMDLDLPSGSTVEAGPIPVSNYERWYPVHRFQTVANGGSTIVFTYRHEYLITVAKWSTGPAASSPLGVVMGDLSGGPAWVPDGGWFGITATAKPGWRFLHWGVFSPNEGAQQSRVSSLSATLRVQVHGPLLLVAGFGQ